MQTNFDLIVVGAGHAGTEAAAAAAKLGLQTLLLTASIDQIAAMPCNPAIGGPAKSHLVKEIDALGGLMGLAADASYLQMKTLNSSKGPAVRALRAQSDKKEYSAWLRQYLENLPNLTIYQSSAKSIIVENSKFKAIQTNLDEIIFAKALVLTAGTFLEARIFSGDKFEPAGRSGEKSSLGLSSSLNVFGIQTARLKTGTPPRLDKRSIQFEILEIAEGDKNISHFSFLPHRPIRPQYPCHITRTNQDTHNIILENLHLSPMYSGLVEASGPRYCPSIEDKVVRFSHNPSHHFFLEPESLSSNEIYLQGCSTSLPVDIQWKMLRTLPGLSQVRITRPAYAVEYDYFPGIQFKHNLESKNISGFFVAGQVLGTSGYEEAAAQGLMAGINASIYAFHEGAKVNLNFADYAQNHQDFVLARSNSYIGTLVDDLVSKEIKDPYRMLTSRSEYRLILRQDNADQRLTRIGRELGLVDDYRYSCFEQKQKNINQEIEYLEKTRVEIGDLNESLTASGFKSIEYKHSNRISLADFLKRHDVDFEKLSKIGFPLSYGFEVETLIKYEGYIDRQNSQINELKKIDEIKIPANFDFASCQFISLEAREKLAKISPNNLGQASRVGGVSPNDIAVLMMLIKS